MVSAAWEKSFVWLLVSWICATESLVCKADHVGEIQSFQGVRGWVVKGGGVFPGPYWEGRLWRRGTFFERCYTLAWTTGSPPPHPPALS